MNFFNIDSRLYRFFEKIWDFLLLNLLWFLFCLPIVTIFPATTAMFGVVRSWLKKEEPSLTKMFFTLFKENFKQSLLLGLVWTFIGFLTSFNLFIGFHMGGSSKLFMVPVLTVIEFLYLSTSIFIFPMLVNYQSNLISVIKNSFLFSISQPLTSLLGIFILACFGIIIYFIPICFLALSSIVSYFIYRVCNKAFKKIEFQKNIYFRKEV